MTPLIFFLLVLALPLTGLLAQHLQSRERRALEMLARDKNLHFACDDRFKIAPKVAELLPTPGAADVRVYDVMYGKDGARYHFVFTVEWTEGVVRWKRRVRRVASFSEEKENTTEQARMHLRLSGDEGKRLKQYQSLYESCCGSLKAGA